MLTKPTFKQYADYFVMGLILNLCWHSEIIAWVDKLIETIEHPTDWMIDLSTSSRKKERDVICILNSVPGRQDFEISFYLLIAKLALVKPVLFTENNRFVEPQDSRLFTKMYLLVSEHDNLPDCIRGNIFQIYMDLDYFDEDYVDWSVIQQNYKNLLTAGKEYHYFVSA